MSNKNADHYFLKGGGEMGELIRAKDWSKTSLGNPSDWPQSLRTMVGVMLDNPFGMYIAWGNDYTQLYNDGYRPILGSTKHPQALGISTRETFSEVWHIIESMFDGVMKGKAVGFPDLMLPLTRNGFVEECYFDFAYSPIRKDTGEVGGVLVTVIETTDKKKAEIKLKESEERFRTMAEASDILIAVSDETSDAIYFNKAWVNLTGRPMDDLLKFGWVDLVHPDDKEIFVNIYLDAFKNKVAFTGEFRVLDKNGEYRWLLAKGPPIFRPDDSFAGYISSCMDITDQKNAIRKTEESELLFRLALAGSNQTVFSQDRNLKHTWIYNPHPDFKAEDVIGKTDEDIHVPSTASTLTVIKQKVLDSGTAFNGDVEIEVSGQKIFYTMHLEAMADANGSITGIIGTVLDITERIKTQQKIEESEQRFQAAVKAVQGILWTNNAKGEMEGEQPGWAALTGQTYKEYQGYGWAQVVHPDDAKPTLDAWNDASQERKTFIFEHRLKTKNGEWRDFSIRAIPLLNAEGIVLQWVGVHTDITENKQAEKALEYRKALLEAHNESSLDGILLVDTKGQMLSTNHRFAEIWNMPQQILDGKKDEAALAFAVTQLVNPEQFMERVRWMYANPKERSIDELEFKDGKIIERYGYHVAGEDGSYYGCSWMFRDITEQRKNERALKESEVRFRTLAQTLPQLIWISDAEGNQEFSSVRWKEYSGIQPNGKLEWKSMVHPEDYDRINTDWIHSLTTGNIYKSEVRLKNKEDEYRWHSGIGQPVFDHNNTIIKWVGAFTDIHEQKLKDERKDEFVSIASHEMKTPLTTAKAYLEMLELTLDDCDNEEATLFTKKANQSIDRLTKLVSELLDVSKIRLGKIQYSLDTFNFNDLIDETVESVQLTSPTHKIIKAGKVNDLIYCDKHRLQQVIINLLSNAIKYSPGAEEVFVTIEQKNDSVNVSVKDNGIGIAQSSLDRIFDKYHRIDEHAVHFQGLGIGLFISFEIIQRHQGKLWATSEAGKGSTFYFTIPINCSTAQ
ncbi:PAS domain-containing sensor histidine kinase [Marivirga sp.]|uniref:PAS domain-containing sensor histidine kinase n=1 Tax=Marivirga sp. TaxID=2018662 RepID=UPI0025FADC7C|nr:PAS domain-containing sensor histidine kinase [Marivirga sp.]